MTDIGPGLPTSLVCPDGRFWGTADSLWSLAALLPLTQVSPSPYGRTRDVENCRPYKALPTKLSMFANAPPIFSLRPAHCTRSAHVLEFGSQIAFLQLERGAPDHYYCLIRDCEPTTNWI